MPASDLWEFCQRLYAEPGIEELCLYLQDQQQVNVLILLWCAWLDVRKEELADDILHSGYRRVRRVNDPALVPLRQARRFIKAEASLSAEVAEQVRGHILAAELAIEKSLLQALECMPMADTTVPPSDTTTLRPLDRLVVYLHLPSDEWVSPLRTAAIHVYPGR